MEMIIEIMLVLPVILLAKKEEQKEQYEKEIAELKQDYEERYNGWNANYLSSRLSTIPSFEKINPTL